MKINLEQIYKELQAWREERGITAQSQKDGYIVNVMEEFGKLASALRLLEKSKRVKDIHEIKCAEHFISDALCDISVFTINAGADIPCDFKVTEIFYPKANDSINAELNFLIERVAHFNKAIIFGDYPKDTAIYFNSILQKCADICKLYGLNFENAMLENIKEISSLTGKEDKVKADYEKARIKK